MDAMHLGVQAALIDGRIVPGDLEIAGDAIVAGGGPGGGRGLAVPGLIDLQINGFAGVDFMATDAGGWALAGERLLECGVTAIQPTFVTAVEEHLVTALRGMPRDGIGVRVIGAHVEGPFISPARLGVHDPAARRAPDLGLLRRLLDAAPVRQVTLAPELAGAFELVDELVARGVVVSAGHTDATAAEAHAAFDRGVRTVTHLFNAMRPAVPRDPGIAYAALAREDVTIQLIADGHHVAPDTVLVAWRAAGGRLALVSDASPAAGAGDGTFSIGGREIVASGGVVRGAEGQLAGSAMTVLDGVRTLYGLGVPLDAALNAATAVPARLAGRPDLGRLVPGAPADVVILDDRLEVQRVLVGGSERVAGAS
jgi:N-acetylglucosamine-6-phosphate deacetylase